MPVTGLATRRRFLAAAGGTAGGVALAGCTAPALDKSSTPPGGGLQAEVALPEELLLGFATAAYQIEGAVRAEGRGLSIWDTFCEQPGAIEDGTSGTVACDHYHRMPADVDLMARLKTQTYRFSVAWPRLFPNGRGQLNQRGLAFYQRLVERLRANDIVPLATLYHWDLPQALQDAGGWPARDTAARFADYAAAVFARLQGIDRWVTINEAKLVAVRGHQRGDMAPGIKSDRATGRVIHHLGLAHGLAIQAFRAAGSPGQIGPCFAVSPCYPADTSTQAAEQTAIADMQANTLYVDPVLRGRYPTLVSELPTEMRSGLLSVERDGDLAIIGQPVDFVGLNYYGPTVVDGSGRHTFHWPRSASGQQIHADSLYDIAVRIFRDHHRPLIITENGTPDAVGVPPLEDGYRIDYLQNHLRALQRAIADGVPVHGFHAWSLMDNFEWTRGLSQRWGLVHVDYPTQERTPKQSAAWFAQVITSRQLSG